MKRFSLVAAVVVVALAGTLLIAGAAFAEATSPTPSAVQSGGPWIGVSVVDLNEKIASRLGISQTAGVAIASVVNGGPADTAGVKAKDLLTSVGGKAVANAKDVTTAVSASKVGDSLALALVRDGKAMSVSVTVGEKPQPAKRGQNQKATPNAQPKSGPLAGLMDGLQGLAPKELFGHFLGSQRRLLDKDNNVVTIKTIPGTVVSATADSITIKPNDSAESGGPYGITADTRVSLAGNAKVETLKAGDLVVITTTDGKTALGVTSAARSGMIGRAPGWFGRAHPFIRGGR